MPLDIEFIPGPLTSQMTRSAAITALKQHPNFQKNSAYAVEQLEGRWVAAIVHQAGFGGPPADDDSEAPGPKSEGPDDTAPSPDDAPGSDGPPDDGGGDGPPKKEKGDKGGADHKIEQMLDMIMQALGLPPMGAGGDSMVPGLDPGAAPPGPPGGPPGPPGAGGPPPPGPPGAGGPPPPPHGGPPHGAPPMMAKQVHERALKPGETPPGGTPIGAPAFASVSPEHPWAHMVDEYASFKVADKIGDRPLDEVHSELQQLAATSGYRVARFAEGRDDDGDRVAMATISVH